MVQLTIDDQKVEVEKGATILEAAEKLGIKIPTLCHHKSLMPYGGILVAFWAMLVPIRIARPRSSQS